MTGDSHTQCQKHLERLFCGAARPNPKAWEHLRQCDACRGDYEKIRRVEEALAEGGAQDLTHASFERLFDDAVLPALEGRAARSGQARGWLKGLGGAFAVGSLFALLMVLPKVPGTGRGDDGFQARGAGTLVMPAGLSTFRITASGAVRLAGEKGPVAVPAKSVLQMAYRNQGARYGAVIGIDEDFSVQWYHPNAAGQVPLAQGVVDEPFGGAWTMQADGGRIRLIGIFSNDAIEPKHIEKAVRRAQAMGTPLNALDSLALDGVWQDSILLEILSP